MDGRMKRRALPNLLPPCASWSIIRFNMAIHIWFLRKAEKPQISKAARLIKDTCYTWLEN